MGSTSKDSSCSTTNTSNCSTPMKAAPLPKLFKGTYGTMYYVKNMKKAVAFYREQVGLTPAFEDEGWTQFDLNGHGLCLHPAGDQPITKGGGTLIIEVTDINKVVSNLKEKRVEFVSEVKDTGGCGFCAEFKDLDGNVVSLYQHTQQN